MGVVAYHGREGATPARALVSKRRGGSCEPDARPVHDIRVRSVQRKDVVSQCESQGGYSKIQGGL